MENQITELRNALKDKRLTKQEYIRVQAVLMRKRGMKRKQIVENIGKSFDSLQEWITQYNKYGISGLYTKKTNEKNASKLKESQRKEIKEILDKQTPKSMKLSKQEYWDVVMLKKLVKSRYAVVYKSNDTYTRLFHYCGFSYQRVEFVDRRKDEKAGNNFKKRSEIRSKEGRISMWW